MILDEQAYMLRLVLQMIYICMYIYPLMILDEQAYMPRHVLQMIVSHQRPLTDNIFFFYLSLLYQIPIQV